MSTRSTDGGAVYATGIAADADRAERILLGALMCGQDILPAVTARITPEDLGNPRHARILRALITGGRPAVPPELTVYAAGLMDGVPVLPPAHVDHYIAAVAAGARRRRIADAGRALAKCAANGASEEDVDALLRDLAEVAAVAEPRRPSPVDLYGPDVAPSAPAFTVTNLIRGAGLHLFWAQPGGLKTWTLLRWMHELLLEAPPARLTGHPDLVIRRGYRRVLWVASEEDAGTLRAKGDMVLRGLGVRALGGRLDFLFAARAGRRVTLDDLPALLEYDGPYDAVVLDSLTGLRPKTVNGQRVKWDLDNDAANEQCLLLRGLAVKHAAAINLVHHTGRDVTRGYRGPTDWWASADVMVGFEPDVPAGGGERSRVRVEKNRDGRALKPFLLTPSWGAEGFYLQYSGDAAVGSQKVSERAADCFLAGKRRATRTEIMAGAAIRSKTTFAAAAKRFVAEGLWAVEAAAPGKATVYIHTAAVTCPGVQEVSS